MPALLVAAAMALIVASATSHRASRRPAPPAASVRRGRRRRLTIPSLRRPPSEIDPSALGAWADDLARALRHGSTLHAALTQTVPNDAVVERRSEPLRHWLDRGATVAQACDEWADELSDDSADPPRRPRDRVELLDTMAAVVAAMASLGGAAAAPLDRFAAAMRQRASDDLERSAQSAQARLSAQVLTSVPLAVLALLLLTDPDVRSVIASSRGAAVLTLGLGLNAAGAVWMRRIAGSGGRVAS